jgi:hypothetical protein
MTFSSELVCTGIVSQKISKDRASGAAPEKQAHLRQAAGMRM